MFVIRKTTWCFLGEAHQAKLSSALGIRKTQGASCDGEGRENQLPTHIGNSGAPKKKHARIGAEDI